MNRNPGEFSMRHVFAAAAVAGLLLCAGQASAHAFLKASTPAVGGTVPQAPSEVVIEFTEGVEPRFSTITVQNAAGARVDTGGVHLAGNDTRLAVALKPLQDGTYKVIWHATATDTHKTQGSFRFTVAQ
jgi:methionine-rich copper-binding protein CopC